MSRVLSPRLAALCISKLHPNTLTLYYHHQRRRLAAGVRYTLAFFFPLQLLAHIRTYHGSSSFHFILSRFWLVLHMLLSHMLLADCFVHIALLPHTTFDTDYRTRARTLRDSCTIHCPFLIVVYTLFI